MHADNTKYLANAYHLPPKPTSGYYGLVITGPVPRPGDQGKVRLDTDLRYESPCITTLQANKNTRPNATSTVRFRVSVTGLASETAYTLKFYNSLSSRNDDTPCGTQQITSDAEGRWTGSPSYEGYQQDWSTDKAFLVRCVSAG